MLTKLVSFCQTELAGRQDYRSVTGPWSPPLTRARPKVRNTLARGICRDLRAARIDPAPLLRQAGVAQNAVKDDDAWLAYESHAKLLECAADELKDPYYGLGLANRVEPKEFGALAYIGLSSRTLEDALRNLERYLAVHTEAWRIRIVVEGDEAAILLIPARPDYSHYDQAAEVGIGVLVRAYQYFLGDRLRPLEIAFVHGLKPARSKVKIEKMLGCPVAFGRTQAQILLDRQSLRLPIRTADDHLLKILKAHCTSVLSEQKPEQASLTAQISQAIADLLPSGRAKAKLVARELGMTERTLHRRLALEGTSFGELHETLCSSLARKYLGEQQLTVKQVAFLLGYSDQSAFGVAFRRWTGRTPKEARKPAN